MVTEAKIGHAGSRGAIILETAIVTATILTLVLGALELGLIGFLQATVDAGAFLNAHYNAVGLSGSNAYNPSQGATSTNAVLPQIPVAAISASVQTAPTPDVPVNYSYQSSPGNAPSNNARHGGASMMQPYLSQTQISYVPFSFLNFPFRVQSQAIEANWLETAPEWDVADSNYGGTYNAANTNYNANYFTNGENTPEYYVSFNFIQHCATAGAWGQGNGVCPNADALSLGVAEHLDNYNWQFPKTGISGAPTDSSGNPQGTTGTFEELACHQRAFATLSTFFASAYAASGNGDTLNYLEKTYNPYYYNDAANNTYTEGGYADFGYGAKFFSQLAPNGTAPSTAASNANNAILEIYGWDVERQFGSPGLGTNPGDNPLFPYKGCS